jgi:hypothetical protein
LVIMVHALVAARPHPMHHHDGDAPEGLGVILGVGIPVLVLTILAVVFVLVRRSVSRRVAETREQAAREGVVLDAGPVWMTVRYNGFRSSNIAVGTGIFKTRVTALLTKERLHFLPGSRRYFSVVRADLGRFEVGLADDGALHLRTSDPPNASGSLDYRLAVPDADKWVGALTEAGARKA